MNTRLLPYFEKPLVDTLLSIGKYFILFILIVSPINSCFASSSSVIDSVDIDETSTHIIISIHFTLSMSYISHFPASSATQLDIRLQPVAGSPNQQEAVSQAQSLGYNSDKTNTLELIRYEPDNPAGTTLSLLFSSATQYSIDNQDDPETLTIKLSKQHKTNNTASPTLNATHKPSGEDIENSENFKYVINLNSSRSDIQLRPYQNRISLQPYFVYATKTSIDNIAWNRVRLGFFRNKDDAQITLKSIKDNFPRAWIDRVKPEEEQYIQPWLEAMARDGHPLVLSRREKKSTKTQSGIVTTKSQRLFAEAKNLIIEGNYRGAIQKLTKLLNMPENESTEAGHELIGVAREKNRQIAHAIAEYRIYLKKYPQGEYRNRVLQRLNGLTHARKAAPKKLRKAKSIKKETPWETYGTVFQFYRRDVDTTDASNDLVTNSSLDTDVSLTSRKRTKKLDIRTQVAGSYQYDLERTDQSKFRLSSLYVDTSDRSRQWNARLGRQSRSSGGVLGRFDGASFGYRISPEWKINAVTGFPVVISSTNQFQTDKHFYGMSIDAGTFKQYWNASAFFIQQDAFDINDRTAVGAELRYLNPKATLFALVDYDIEFNSLNIAQLISNIRLPYQTTINFVADYRNSPVLTTSNALQGQTGTTQTNATLEKLLETYTEDEIKQLAQDRTAVFRSVSGTLSKALKEDLLFSIDLAASHLESTPASGGVDATPSTGIEYFYGAQIIASNIFKKGDTALFGLRYADTASSDTLTLSINSRFPYKKHWRFNPRLRVDDQSRTNSAQILKIRPSFRVDYRARRNLKIELELGYEQAEIDDNFGSRQESNYFINMGYIADF